MFKVLEFFTDMKDGRYAYQAGDVFPREGLEVSEERIQELSTSKNRRHMPLIEYVDETSEVKEELKEEEKPKRRGRKADVE